LPFLRPLALNNLQAKPLIVLCQFTGIILDQLIEVDISFLYHFQPLIGQFIDM